MSKENTTAPDEKKKCGCHRKSAPASITNMNPHKSHDSVQCDINNMNCVNHEDHELHINQMNPDKHQDHVTCDINNMNCHEDN